MGYRQAWSASWPQPCPTPTPARTPSPTNEDSGYLAWWDSHSESPGKQRVSSKLGPCCPGEASPDAGAGRRGVEKDVPLSLDSHVQLQRLKSSWQWASFPGSPQAAGSQNKLGLCRCYWRSGASQCRRSPPPRGRGPVLAALGPESISSGPSKKPGPGKVGSAGARERAAPPARPPAREKLSGSRWRRWGRGTHTEAAGPLGRGLGSGKGSVPRGCPEQCGPGREHGRYKHTSIHPLRVLWARNHF